MAQSTSATSARVVLQQQALAALEIEAALSDKVTPASELHGKIQKLIQALGAAHSAPRTEAENRQIEILQKQASGFETAVNKRLGIGKEKVTERELVEKVAKSFLKGNLVKATTRFERLCVQFPHAAGGIYGQIWKLNGSPTDGDLAHPQFGDVVFHDKHPKGFKIDNAKKAEAVNAYASTLPAPVKAPKAGIHAPAFLSELMHKFEKKPASVEQQVTDLAKRFEAAKEDETALLAEFATKLQPQLGERLGKIYGAMWKIMGSPTDKEKADIARPDFGKVVFHNEHSKCKSSPQQKAEALRAALT